MHEVVGVDADAVTADARRGIVGHEPVGLARGPLGDLDRVETVGVAGFGDLEGQRDVDGAEGVLVQLDHLGGLGRGDTVQPLAGVAQHGGGATEARLADASEHARRAGLRVLIDAGVDALGGERDEHVLTGVQPALGERLHEQLARATDVCGRGEHDRLLGTGVAHDRRARGPQRAWVGRAPLVDRRGHADQHEVGRVERLAAVGEHEAVAFEVPAQADALGVEQLGLAGADLRQALVRAVEADDPAAGVAQGDRRRQPDIAEPDDGDHGVLARDGRRGGLRCGGAGTEQAGLRDLGPRLLELRPPLLELRPPLLELRPPLLELRPRLLDRRVGRDVSQHGNSPLLNSESQLYRRHTTTVVR
jgi:hypothetical protein